MTNNINWLTVFNLSIINYLIILLLLTQRCLVILESNIFFYVVLNILLILFFPLRNIPVRTIDLIDDFMILSESSLRRRHHSHPYCLTDR